jgi:uncharacterized protein GlcG (DUF336 family)
VNQLSRTFLLQSLAYGDISVEQALLVAQGAISECKQKDNSVSQRRGVDRDGLTRFLLRGDGLRPKWPTTRRKKAYTARTFRQSHFGLDGPDGARCRRR